MDNEIVIWSDVIHVSSKTGALVYQAGWQMMGSTVTIEHEGTKEKLYASIVEYGSADGENYVYAAVFPEIPIGNYKVYSPSYSPPLIKTGVDRLDDFGVKRITIFAGRITRM